MLNCCCSESPSASSLTGGQKISLTKVDAQQSNEDRCAAVGPAFRRLSQQPSVPKEGSKPVSHHTPAHRETVTQAPAYRMRETGHTVAHQGAEQRHDVAVLLPVQTCQKRINPLGLGRWSMRREVEASGTRLPVRGLPFRCGEPAVARGRPSLTSGAPCSPRGGRSCAGPARRQFPYIGQ